MRKPYLYTVEIGAIILSGYNDDADSPPLLNTTIMSPPPAFCSNIRNSMLTFLFDACT